MRGSIVKRQGKATKDGKPITLYYIVYQVGQRQKWEAVPERTRKAAEKLLAKRLNEISNGEYREPSRMTFGEFKDVWVEKYARGQVRPSTMTQYGGYFRNHMLPVFGGMELAEIGAEDVQGFMGQMLDKKLSPTTVMGALRLIRQMFDHAVDWGYLRRNPAEKVKGPRTHKPDVDFLTPDEIGVFLDNVPEKWYGLFYMAITTGLRIGELFAAKWSNLDWNKGKYFVKENLDRKGFPDEAEKAQGFRFAELKTESSRQSVDLTPACLDALREHRARQAEEKLRTGESYQDYDLMFATPIGTPLDSRNFDRRVLDPALKKAGLRHIRLHDLRHTCASLLINQGESPKYVQRQMRHASIKITFDRYGHLFPEASREAVRRLDATLSSSRGQAGAGGAI